MHYVFVEPISCCDPDSTFLVCVLLNSLENSTLVACVHFNITKKTTPTAMIGLHASRQPKSGDPYSTLVACILQGRQRCVTPTFAQLSESKNGLVKLAIFTAISFPLFSCSALPLNSPALLMDSSLCSPGLSCSAPGLSCCTPGISCCAPGLSCCTEEALADAAENHLFFCRGFWS